MTDLAGTGLQNAVCTLGGTDAFQQRLRGDDQECRAEMSA